MFPLRYSTASQEILLGRFVDSGDGNTEETELTIANTDIKLFKSGATTLASKNSGGATHIANGMYYAVLDATDTDTLGALEIHVHVSGVLSVKLSCVVYPQKVYDSLFAGSDNLEVDIIQLLGTAWLTPGTAGTPDVNIKLISDDATAANNAESFFDGTGYAGTNNVIPTVTTAGLADDAITASKFDESTAFPLKSADAGATAVARTGADSDTLETLSDQIDIIAGYVDSIPGDILDHAIIDHLTAGTVGNLIASLGGKMTVTGNQLIVYAANNTTELFRFNLTDSADDPTMTDVYTRTWTTPPE